MNFLDLFHGIGGFALGAYWAGMKFNNHYCSDIEPYCQKLYKLRFPQSIQLGDITKIEPEKLSKGEWIITGGFPCQDISLAGKGAGIEGSRSGLWSEMFRLIGGIRPRVAIIENVPALSFRGLDRVLADLAEIGYDAEWQNISAAEIRAWHKRERIWIVTYPNNKGLSEFEPQRTQQQSWLRFDWISLQKTWRTCDTSKAFLRRGDDGIPKRVDRIRGLGNSIVPQIAQLLFSRVKEL